MTESQVPSEPPCAADHYEVLHILIDEVLARGVGSARDLARLLAVGPYIRTIEAHVATAELKTAGALSNNN